MNLHHLTVRRLRLLSGLVMFAYITIHLLNHALGLVSLSLAESGLGLAMTLWRSPPATLLLYGAAATHFSLALWTLYSRRDWRLPWIEILRLASGFSLPMLLIGHAVTTRLGDTLYAIQPSYAAIIANLIAGGTQGMQLALLAPGWLHGCLGLWISLRRFETVQRLKPGLTALVVLLPLLAAGRAHGRRAGGAGGVAKRSDGGLSRRGGGGTRAGAAARKPAARRAVTSRAPA